MPRHQFSIRTLLWLALVVAAFLGGIGFEKERRKSAKKQEPVTVEGFFKDIPHGGPSVRLAP